MRIDNSTHPISCISSSFKGQDQESVVVAEEEFALNALDSADSKEDLDPEKVYKTSDSEASTPILPTPIREQNHTRFGVTKHLRKEESVKPSSLPYAITLVTIFTPDRIPLFREQLRAWAGPISAALAFLPSETSLLPSLHTPPLPSRVRLTLHSYHSVSAFPVNRLRNLAIRNVSTSHFFYNDVDFIPSQGLQEALLRLSLLRREAAAIIVPAFEYLPRTAVLSKEFAARLPRFLRQIPRTKLQLRSCVEARNCTVFRATAHLHNYLTPAWFAPETSTSAYRVPCFSSDRQEPYLLVRYSPSLPLYDESFIGYGYNKVQWIEHLRYVGYSFYVLNDGFIIHTPHPASPSLKMFGAKMFRIQKIWKAFLRKLHKEKSNATTPFCKKVK